MKKNYLIPILLLVPFVVLTLMSNASGRTAQGNSGSPGDSGATCSNCHSGGNFGASASITTNIPASGYSLNTNYTVTVTVNNPGSSSKRGFQLTAEKSGGTKVGTFTAGTGSQTFNANKAITHTSAGNTATSWTFTWKSPATNEGNVVFYAAVNVANGNGGTTGDQVITTSTNVSVLGNDSFEDKTLTLYPNPTSDYLQVGLPSNVTTAQIRMFDYLSRNVLNQSITTDNNTIDVSNLSKGNYLVSIDTSNGIVNKTVVIE